MIRLPPRSTLFPTRRSSDLGFGLDGEELEEEALELHDLADLHLGFLQHRERVAPAVEIAQRAARGLRSEEHTSELQSQSNLVCRLLLEKKKYNIMTTIVLK